MKRAQPIAIVGIGGIFPDAPTLERFWENVAARRCVSREAPEGRWLLTKEEAYDPVKGAPDKVYSTKACFIEGFTLDPEGLALDRELIAKLDPLFHLALHAARQAFQGAKTKGLDRSKVGVVIGNIVLPSDSSSALAREILTPAFAEKILGKTPAGAQTVDPINRYVAGLPGGLIAKALGLGGGSYTLDAACASSLYAIKLAVDELRSGRADAMLTGGVSRPESLYTQMGFSQLRALSASGTPSPFDAAADGLVVGEGAGMFLLKRLEDAERDGDEIHGVISGIGLSNDVGGSLLAPNTVGQLRAMRQAYKEAGLSPSQVDYVECHATGTPTGDPIEVASLKALWGERGWTHGQCALGSVKSNIGHLLTAAGSAGLMKLLLSFKKKTLPPTANFKKTPTTISLENSPFRVQSECAEWKARSDGSPRRAAISAFGFGGINAHVLVEEYAPQKAVPRKKAAASPPVAIVGMEARFGSLNGLRQFQEAVLAGNAAAMKAPEQRWWGVEASSWFKGRYLSDNRWSGYFLSDVGAAADAFRIPPKELEEMLPQQLLMLCTAAAAIRDAKLPEDNRDRAGVFIGLGLDLGATNFNFRWSLLAKAKEWAAAQGWRLSEAEMAEYVKSLRDAAGPALSANRTMGALGGIVASRIAREFHIGGPSFTISSEESSSLRALEVGVRALQNGELDSAIVGGVDIAGDLRSILGTHAGRPFSASSCARPFDKTADGTVSGEGAAAVVLKRLDDAVRDGDRIYAVIKGVGCSSGVQAYASSLRKAYAEAGADPATVGYLEAHGSGTPQEDAQEAAGLADVFGIASAKLPCALGSVKAEIGHAGAAAGLASLVKAALAVYQEILPPLKALKEPSEELRRAAKRFHVPQRPQYWLRDRADGPRRAGVSALGIDGNCVHVVLEGVERLSENQAVAAERRQPLGVRREALFTIEADAVAEVLKGVAALKVWARTQEPDTNIELLARRWWTKNGSPPAKRLGLAMVARDWAELLRLLQAAEQSISDNPERPLTGDRIHFTSRPAFGKDAVAFVFPGSGNQYLGMGVELGVQWPEILRAFDRENGFLRSQMVPERFAPWRFSWNGDWQAEAESDIVRDYQAMIMGSVAHGTVMSDLIRSFGVEPKSVIGYSLGETAGLFATRTWTGRDEMLRRMKESSLFVSDLAGPCDAARRFWNLPNEERVDWVLGVIDRPADTVKMALKGAERAALLIVNAPLECVVGGYRNAVNSLVEGLGCVFLPLQGVSTVHFPAAKLVEKKYRDLHLFPTTPPAGIKFYSGAWGKVYDVTRESAADSIVTQAVKSIDFSALIKRAYDDGARVFLELGPQASCSRMIGKILGPLPHMARSACVRGQEPVSTVLRFLAQLVAERVPVDLSVLYGQKSFAVGHQDGEILRNRVITPLGSGAFQRPAWKPKPSAPVAAPPPPARVEKPAPVAARPLTPVALAPTAMTHKAHEVFLRMSQRFAEVQARNISFQNALLGGAPLTAPASPEVFMDREQCLEFAVGKIGAVLGEAFAHADAYPTRVRLPAEPLMLVDRILSVKGEPNSLKSGSVVTEHDIHPDSWYLDGGRIPTCVAVEAGQADLFLSGYLGIDAKTKGTAVYRLLDAEVTFHRALPRAGEVIRYDINIERFVQHGDIWLFFFNFESTVGRRPRLLEGAVPSNPEDGDGGQPLLSMKKGCAGFFTRQELAAGKGVVLTVDDLKPLPGKKPADWEELAPFTSVESYDDGRIASLRAGDLAACFGPAFSKIKDAFTLPGGRMRLVDRVLELDPKGGRYGLGQIRAEADIHPDDWHLTCHFIDDNVMPGTLMYECCLHALRIFLMRMGWVGAKGGSWTEPKPGVQSRLICRGQVLADTKKVVYEISIKELGYGPEPFAIADALMYADGKPIVHILDMSIRLGGLDRQKLGETWKGEKRAIFDSDSILAFAVGKPSVAFGAPYKVFDSERVIARLPGPPYKFLDRIVDIKNCEAFKLAAGGEIEAEYDVPPEEWYFKSNGQPTMPFAVLLEVGLQPSGWLAAYVGSALASPIDLSYRNLGGTGTQFIDVGPDIGRLTTKVKLTKVSQSGGMIIQNNDFEISCPKGLVYRGKTEFGFFTKAALGQQVGVRGAKPMLLSAPGRLIVPSKVSGMPDEKLLMLDSVEFEAKGGPAGLGLLKGLRKVDPSEWFFKAHFYQDPVCPGSLGLESFIQLMKVYARERWSELLSTTVRFESMALGEKHEWVYRGQYTPVNKLVEVSAVISQIDDARRMIKADGFLRVDGLTIYQMKEFALRVKA